MKRSKRESTRKGTERSKRLKSDRDLKEKMNSATDELGGKQKKLKLAIMEGLANKLGVPAKDIPTEVTKLIWKFQNAERECEALKCNHLYRTLHTHEGAKWVEVDKWFYKFFFHEDCDSTQTRNKSGGGRVELEIDISEFE